MSIGQTLLHSDMRAVIRERDELLRDQDGVTAVVPCYQQAEYLGDCLESLEAQTVPPLEVLVVDDGSDAIQATEINLLCDRYDARYIRVTNRHLAGARNTGLMLARGRGYLPLDADDTIHPAFIEKTWPLLNDHDVVSVGLQEHGARNGRYDPGWDRPLSEVNEGYLWRQNVLFYCALYRTDLLRSVGGYNTRMIHGWEDYDLHIDLFRRGARYVAVNEPLLNYRTSNDGMMAAAAREHRDWNLAEMRRHHLG